MAILDRDLFLKVQNEALAPKSELVEIAPGYEVKVVQLTAEEGLDLYSTNGEEDQDKQGKTSTLKWVAACCKGENGSPIFTIEDVQNLPAQIVFKLAAAVNRVNELASGDNAIEEAEKNSEATTS